MGAEVQVVGVDGTKKGWVAVSATEGRPLWVTEFAGLSALAAALPDASCICVDIPLFLPDVGDERATDAIARQTLGKRSSSLFPIPPRRILEAPDYSSANQLARDLTGKGISSQSYHLRGKVFEAVDFLAASRDPRFWEIHPEVSFQVLAEKSGRSITSSKKTWAGMVERWQLLETCDLAPQLKATPDARSAAVDDVLDAAVAAWTAHRIANGEAVHLGETDAPTLPNGNPGVIVA